MRHPLAAAAATAAVAAVAALIAFVSVPAGPRDASARAAAARQDSSALINEALDKPVEVRLNTALPQALQEITEKTGVPIELAPGVLDLLPWGEQTNLDVTIANQTLRQALAAIARKLGLVYVLTPEAVELRPMPALQRLGRRANVDEIRVLDLLASTPLGLGADNTRPTLKQLRAAVDAELEELKSDFAVEYRAGGVVKDDVAVSVPRNASVADALDAIAAETPLAWGAWGRSVLIKPKAAWVRDQLEKSMTRRFAAVDVGQVLSELSEYSGVDFTIEPGAVQRIAPQSRTITLILQNRAVGQVLEDIAGFTGLSYAVRDEGVHVWNDARPAGGAGGGGGGPQDPVIAILPLPDSGMELMLRQSQVPDDVRQYIRHRFGKEIAKLRVMMKEEGFQPATQPAGAQKPADGATPDDADTREGEATPADRAAPADGANPQDEKPKDL